MAEAHQQDMEETIGAAFDSLGSEEPEEPEQETPEPEVPESTETEESLEQPEEPEAPEEPEETEESEAEEPEIAAEFDAVPSTWRKEAAADWDKVPPTVRQEIHRREQNMIDGINQYKQAAEFGAGLHKEIQPYEAMLRSLNAQPAEAVRYMLNNEYVLRTGSPQSKADLIAQAIKDYQIDPNLVRLDGGEPQAPELQPLQQEVQELKRALAKQQYDAQQAQQAALRAEHEELNQEVEEFKSELDDSGKPKYPHFETVRQDMSALIANGRANDLHEAYDKAVWAHPEVRARLLSAQEAEKRRAAAKKAAEAKKAAAANVQSQGTLPEKPTTGTMDDTLKETYDRLMGES